MMQVDDVGSGDLAVGFGGLTTPDSRIAIGEAGSDTRHRRKGLKHTNCRHCQLHITTWDPVVDVQIAKGDLKVRELIKLGAPA